MKLRVFRFVPVLLVAMPTTLMAQDYAGGSPGDGSDFIVVLALWILVGGALGGIIGWRRGSSMVGFLLGALLGPLGWLLVLVSKPQPLTCPGCSEAVYSFEKLCPKCAMALSRAAR